MAVGQRVPGSPHRSAAAIARRLEAAVRVGRPETARGGAHLARRLDSFLSRLAASVEAHVALHGFLRFEVNAAGLLFRGKPVRPGDRHHIAAALLHGGEVRELLFKQGVSRREVELLVGVLQHGPLGLDGAESVATLLWQADLQRIAFRCREDFFIEPRWGREQFDVVNTPVAHVEDLHADTALEALYSSARSGEGFPSLDLDDPHASWRQLFQERKAARLDTKLLAAEACVGRMAELLAGIQLTDEDADTQALARSVLLRTLDLQLRSMNLTAVREMLRKLRPATAHPAVSATLKALGERLCGPQHADLLATLVHDAPSHPEQTDVVAEILQLLGDGALAPLWRQLCACDDPHASERLTKLLALACAGEPRVLAEHVDEESWQSLRLQAAVLGCMGGARVLPYLGRLKRHDDMRVRVEVVRALLTNEQQAATTLLCELLEDPEPRVRQTAVWALASRGDARASTRLRRLIFEVPAFRDLGESERDDFFRAYGRLADEAALHELATLLERRNLLGRGWKAELRRGAALALGDSSWPQARRLLEKHARDRDARLRAACRAALHGFHDARMAKEEDRGGE